MTSSNTTSLAQSRVYAFNNIGTSPIMLVSPNPSRASITFHNPGSQLAYVFPLRALDPNSGQNYILMANLGALGGCFALAFKDTLFIGGSSAKMEWHGMSASGSGNPLTVSEE